MFELAAPMCGVQSQELFCPFECVKTAGELLEKTPEFVRRAAAASQRAQMCQHHTAHSCSRRRGRCGCAGRLDVLLCSLGISSIATERAPWTLSAEPGHNASRMEDMPTVQHMCPARSSFKQILTNRAGAVKGLHSETRSAGASLPIRADHEEALSGARVRHIDVSRAHSADRMGAIFLLGPFPIR
jgi:hypothetical protein